MRFYRKTILLLALLLAAAAVQAQTDTTALLRAEQQRFDAMTGKDIARLQVLIEDGLVYIHSNGLIQDKASFISSIEKGTMVYTAITVKERHARIYGKTGIINGIVHVSGILNGTPFDVDLRFTDVFYRKKGWKMLSWQSLKVVAAN